MTDEPYLIAHKVRGEPAFDIAIQVPCPECASEGCPECDDLGYWWICSTSGWRAYPYWSQALNHLMIGDRFDPEELLIGIPSMPSTLVDHFPINPTTRAKAADAGRNLLTSLGLASPPIKRRI